MLANTVLAADPSNIGAGTLKGRLKANVPRAENATDASACVNAAVHG
jgi:hypothetical protein